MQLHQQQQRLQRQSYECSSTVHECTTTKRNDELFSVQQFSTVYECDIKLNFAILFFYFVFLPIKMLTYNIFLFKAPSFQCNFCYFLSIH